MSDERRAKLMVHLSNAVLAFDDGPGAVDLVYGAVAATLGALCDRHGLSADDAMRLAHDGHRRVIGVIEEDADAQRGEGR